MKTRYIVIVTLALSMFGCNSKSVKQTDTGEIVETRIKAGPPISNSKFVKDFTKKAEKLISDNTYTPFDVLQSQKLDRIEENSEIVVSQGSKEEKNGNQMYYHLQESTLVIGSSYLCKQCPNVHLSNASGFIIHEDGVIVTNYHVIEVKENMEVSAIFASDYQGNVYPVSKILSASQSNDMAILQLDTKGKKLKALPVADEELLGENVFMMGHPYGNYFFMSKGIVARRFISERDSEVKMAVTSEFGQGASGGPIVNQSGELVAMVSGVHPHTTENGQGATVMVTREAIPVSVINSYIKHSTK